MPRSICDLSDDHPQQVQVGEPIFRDFGSHQSFHGAITTVRCFEDNVLLRQILSTPGQDRVMIVDGGGSLKRALVGDKLAALMISNGWAGIVVNGAVRDVENLREMAVAVRALSICPSKPAQNGTGERDVVVRFAGVTFRPGDWLYADENGLIVSETPLS